MTSEKRYQVFVSSTFADLRVERRAVIQAVMELDCIPAGMELFPATDDEQWSFIQRIIDDCDYYILLVGGRYGSLTKEGVSYTEAEFDYAVKSGMRVLAFLHEDPEALWQEPHAEDEDARAKLMAFRERVAADRIVKYWKNGSDLPGSVALSLAKTMRAYPATGWIRASEAATIDVLQEVNDLRKERDALQARVRQLEAQAVPALEGLAGLDQAITLTGTTKGYRDTYTKTWEVSLTFGEVFAALAPYLMHHPNEGTVKLEVKGIARRAAGRNGNYQSTTMDDQVFQTIKIQLLALRLVKTMYAQTTKGGMATFWSLTEAGERQMYEMRAIRSP